MCFAEARDNPFFPSESVKDMPVSSNIIETRDPLKRAALTLPDSARIIKEIAVKYQNLDGTIETKSISLDHTVDWHLPLFVSQSYANSKPLDKSEPPETETRQIVADFEFIKFAVIGKELHIMTEDRLIRHFLMINPYRIVLDFQRDADFRTFTQNVTITPYVKIVLGNHKGYYRSVITLDGQYSINISKEPSGIVIRSR